MQTSNSAKANIVRTEIKQLGGATYQISQSTDDADADTEGSFLSTNATNVSLTTDRDFNHYIFLRFDNISLNQGETVDSAYLDFRAMFNEGNSWDATINGIDEDDTATYSTFANATGRSLTTASETWTMPSVTADEWYSTVDISSIINEIVARPGWSSGQAIGIRLYSTYAGFGTNSKFFYSYDNDPASAPKLTIGSPGIVSKANILRTESYDNSVKAQIVQTRTYNNEVKANILTTSTQGNSAKASIYGTNQVHNNVKSNIVVQDNVYNNFVKANIIVGNTYENNVKASISNTISYNNSVKASIDFTVNLVSPTDTGSAVINTPFVWTIPARGDNKHIHFWIEIDDTDETFSNKVVSEISSNSPGFEYFDGLDWQTFPAGGVSSTYYGNEARYNQTLPFGTYYWRVRPGVDSD